MFGDLFSRDASGRIKVWRTWVVQDDDGIGVIYIDHGLLAGKHEREIITIKEGKNIGKANATNPYTQAIAEAEGRWNHKKREGYKSLTDLLITVNDIDHEGKKTRYYSYPIPGTTEATATDLIELAIAVRLPAENTDADGNLKPMKAQPYEANKGKFPYIAQPKLNGFRCVARVEMRKVGMFEEPTIVFRSKNGLEYKLPHVAKDLEKVFTTTSQDIVLDGEMYIHGYPLQKISSAVRKPNPDTLKLKFYIFDLAIPMMGQAERLARLAQITDGSAHFRLIMGENGKKKVIDAYGASLNYRVVPYLTVNSDEAVQQVTTDYIEAGFEGAILREPKVAYAFGKRPRTMLKVKRSKDREYTIVDIIPMDKEPTFGLFVCVTPAGKRFKVTPEGSAEVREDYLTNKAKYIGKPLTVRFFEYTEDDIPFHAVGVTIRDYE